MKQDAELERVSQGVKQLNLRQTQQLLQLCLTRVRDLSSANTFAAPATAVAETSEAAATDADFDTTVGDLNQLLDENERSAAIEHIQIIGPAEDALFAATAATAATTASTTATTTTDDEQTSLDFAELDYAEKHFFATLKMTPAAAMTVTTIPTAAAPFAAARLMTVEHCNVAAMNTTVLDDAVTEIEMLLPAVSTTATAHAVTVAVSAEAFVSNLLLLDEQQLSPQLRLQPQQTTAQFADLPRDLMHCIFQHLSVIDCVSLSQCSQLLLSTCHHAAAWYFKTVNLRLARHVMQQHQQQLQLWYDQCSIDADSSDQRSDGHSELLLAQPQLLLPRPQLYHHFTAASVTISSLSDLQLLPMLRSLKSLTLQLHLDCWPALVAALQQPQQQQQLLSSLTSLDLCVGKVSLSLNAATSWQPFTALTHLSFRFLHSFYSSCDWSTASSLTTLQSLSLHDISSKFLRSTFCRLAQFQQQQQLLSLTVCMSCVELLSTADGVSVPFFSLLSQLSQLQSLTVELPRWLQQPASAAAAAVADDTDDHVGLLQRLQQLTSLRLQWPVLRAVDAVGLSQLTMPLHSLSLSFCITTEHIEPLSIFLLQQQSLQSLQWQQVYVHNQAYAPSAAALGQLISLCSAPTVELEALLYDTEQVLMCESCTLPLQPRGEWMVQWNELLSALLTPSASAAITATTAAVSATETTAKAPLSQLTLKGGVLSTATANCIPLNSTCELQLHSVYLQDDRFSEQQLDLSARNMFVDALQQRQCSLTPAAVLHSDCSLMLNRSLQLSDRGCMCKM